MVKIQLLEGHNVMKAIVCKIKGLENKRVLYGCMIFIQILNKGSQMGFTIVHTE